jgi:hypothetical protein
MGNIVSYANKNCKKGHRTCSFSMKMMESIFVDKPQRELLKKLPLLTKNWTYLGYSRTLNKKLLRRNNTQDPHQAEGHVDPKVLALLKGY